MTKFFLMAALVFLGVHGALGATLTTMTFDDLPSGTDITSQYGALGVTVSGARAIDAASTPWAANSGLNIADSPTGGMVFSLNPAIMGDVQGFSAYISGDSSIGVFAYDANGALVGQTATSGPTNSLFVSLNSLTTPITTVVIHDGGSTFAIDTLSFVSTLQVATCTSVTQTLYDSAAALPDSDFKKASMASTQRTQIMKDIIYFNKLVTNNASNSKLKDQLSKIRDEIKDWLKTTSSKANLLQLVNQLNDMIKLNQC